MKNSLSLVFLFSAFIGLSQSDIEKTVGEFSTLKVYDLINVEMIKSKNNTVVISGDNKEDVKVINRNGKLKIRMSTQEIYDGNNTHVTLYYTSVDVIDANEGANIKVKDVIEQYEIEIKTQEGAEVSAKVKTTYANLRAVTGGIINLEGKSEHQNISIYTGGILDAKDLETEYTEVSINAGGDATINTKEKAIIKIKAGGDVYVYGDPKVIDEKRILGGRVKRM